MDEIQKLILDKLDHVEEKMDKLGDKIDNITSEKIPNILVSVAKINAKTGHQAKLHTILGGAIAVMTSIGISVAAMLLK